MPQSETTRGVEMLWCPLELGMSRCTPLRCLQPISEFVTIDFSWIGKEEEGEEKIEEGAQEEEKADYQMLQAQWERNMRDLSRRRYSRVSVLLLHWEEKDSSYLDTGLEIEQLRRLFEVSYNFSVHKRSLKFDLNAKMGLQKSIRKSLLDFAYEEDKLDSLLIIYYAGHGSPGIGGGLIDTGGSRRMSRNKLDEVVWAQCTQFIQNIDLADFLMIFDCCFAGKSCGTMGCRSWPTKAFEFVSGPQSDRPAISPRPESFTSALVRSLEELCNDKGGCTTSRPYNWIDGVPDLPHNEKTLIVDAPARTSHSFILWRSRKRYPGPFKIILTMAGGLLAETAAALVIHNYNPMKQRPSTLDRFGGPQVDENRVGSAHLSWSSFNMLLTSLWDPARRDDAVSWMAKLVRDPGSAVFVSSCAILSLSLVYLMQKTRHHRYQNNFVVSGAFCGVVTGILMEPRERILVDVFTKYLPAMAVAAHVLSLVFHQIFRSWGCQVTCQAKRQP